MKYCYGVDIGGTTVKMGLFEENGNILDKWEIVTRVEDEGKEILPDIAASILEKTKEHGLEKTDIIGIGAGVPAPVTADGIVNGSANLGWTYKEVKRELEELTGITSVIGNDANVAALGEMWKGGGAGQKNMVMITLGTGVGGGVIINGRVITGEHGAGGEVGHLCVNYDEPDTCGCGNHGCLEQYASATGIVRLAKKRLERDTRETVLKKERVTAKDVFDAVKAGDAVAIDVAEEFGKYLAAGLINLAVIADPAVTEIPASSRRSAARSASTCTFRRVTCLRSTLPISCGRATNILRPARDSSSIPIPTKDRNRFRPRRCWRPATASRPAFPDLRTVPT